MEKSVNLSPKAGARRAILVFAAALAAVPAWATDQAAPITGESSAQAQAPEPSLPQIPSWKASFSSSFFDMKGSQSANNDLYSFGNFNVFAEMMNVQYTLAPGWNLVVVGQYLDNYVQTKIFGTVYQDHTSGLGDTTLAVAHPLLVAGEGRFVLMAQAGVSVPTGSIDAPNQNFPQLHDAYFMQLGSGTYDGVFSLTSLYGYANPTLIRFGDALSSTVRTGMNDNGYRLGNLYRADGWAELPLKYGFTPRILGYYRLKNGIDGADPTLPRQPLTEFYYHNQADWDVAAGLRYDHPLWSSLSLTAEADLPFYQGMANYDNVVIRTNFFGTVSLNGQF